MYEDLLLSRNPVQLIDKLRNESIDSRRLQLDDDEIEYWNSLYPLEEIESENINLPF